VGKSTFAINVAAHVAIEQKGRVLYVTTRETPAQVVTRVLAIRAGIRAGSFVDGALQELDYARLAPAMNEISECGLALVESDVDLGRVLNEAPPEDDLDLLVIDAVDPDPRIGADLAGRRGTAASLREYRQLASSRRTRVLVLADVPLAEADKPGQSGRAGHWLLGQSDLVVRLTSRVRSDLAGEWEAVDATVIKGGILPGNAVQLAINTETGLMAEVASPEP
jgi:hypothetical protein